MSDKLNYIQIGTPLGKTFNRREYAAIRLKVPDSGVAWIDEMILESNRNELAAMILQGMLSYGGGSNNKSPASYFADYCYEIADAIMEEKNTNGR